jgi:hypothetical protein
MTVFQCVRKLLIQSPHPTMIHCVLNAVDSWHYPRVARQGAAVQHYELRWMWLAWWGTMALTMPTILSVAGASQEGWVMMLMRPLSPLHPILNQDEVWLVHPVCLLWQKEATSFPGGRAEADFCLGIGLKQVHDRLEKSLIRIWNGVSPVVHLSPNVFLNIQRESVAAPLPL